MDRLSDREREQFVQERIKNIFEERQTFQSRLSEMSQADRDDFVHRRIENDLATQFAILQKEREFVEFKVWTWRAIVVIDIVALLGLVGIALRDLRDVMVFAGVAVAMLASRVVNYILTQRAQEIQFLLTEHLSRSGNTAALDFLVDAVQLNGDAHE